MRPRGESKTVLLGPLVAVGVWVASILMVLSTLLGIALVQ